MNRYIEIPRSAIVARLESYGFKRLDVRGEVTYIRYHDKDPRYTIKVYTSVAEFNDTARDSGTDAIRIVALFTWYRRHDEVPRYKKLYQARVLRVNSVDGVLDRIGDKAREAYAACNEHRLKTFTIGAK